MSIDQRTEALALPLPHPENDLRDDVLRLRTALIGIDQQFASIDLLLGSDVLPPAAVQELVALLVAARTEMGAVAAVVETQLAAQRRRDQLRALAGISIGIS